MITTHSNQLKAVSQPNATPHACGTRGILFWKLLHKPVDSEPFPSKRSTNCGWIAWVCLILLAHQLARAVYILLQESFNLLEYLLLCHISQVARGEEVVWECGTNSTVVEGAPVLQGYAWRHHQGQSSRIGCVRAHFQEVVQHKNGVSTMAVLDLLPWWRRMIVSP